MSREEYYELNSYWETIKLQLMLLMSNRMAKKETSCSLVVEDLYTMWTKSVRYMCANVGE